MNEQSAQVLANQALQASIMDCKYLQEQTLEQLQKIRHAASYLITKQVPQVKWYILLKENVERRISINQYQTKNTQSDQLTQFKKVESEITAKEFFWTKFVSAHYVGILVYLKGLDKKSQWRGYLIIGLIVSLIIVVTIIIFFYNCRCGKKLDDQEVKRIQEKIEVKLNE